MQAIKRRKHETRAKASAIQWTWQMLSATLHIWQFSIHPDEDKKVRNVWEYRREKWSRQALKLMENEEVRKIRCENGEEFEPEADVHNRVREWQQMVAEDELARMAKHDTSA